MNKISVIRISNFLFIFFIVFCINAVFRKALFSDFDTGWHIRSGYLIRFLGFVPQTDPWAFTSDQVWYNLSWLWDVIISYINDIIGEKYLPLFNSFLFGILIAYLYVSLDNFGIYKSDAKMVTIALSALVISDLAFFRPQMVTYIMALFFLNTIHKGLKRNTLVFYLKIQLLILLWVNIHGSFLAVYSVLGAYGIEALLNKNYKWLKRLIIATLISLPVIFINPYGPEIIIGIARTLDSAVTSYIYEWKPLTFGHYYGFSLLLLVFVLASGFNDIRISFASKILAIIWLCAALSSIRFFGYLTIFGTPYICACLSKNLPYGKNKASLPLYVKILGICIALSGWQLLTYMKVVEIDDTKGFPKEIIATLTKQLPGKKFFNDYNQGGAIIYYGDGKIRQFIDSRAGTVFSEEFLKEYLLFHNLQAPLSAFYKKYQFDGVILGKEYLKSITVAHFLKDWTKIFENDRVGIFLHPRYTISSAGDIFEKPVNKD